MEKLITASDLDKYRARCEVIVDVRSPAEFAEDHIPDAVNWPVLDDAQRAEVGTLHRQNPFAARKLGAMYVTGSVHRFLADGRLQEARRGTGFLIYCARGGQRSSALSTILSEIGFPVFRLEQGYKSYRRAVLNRFEQPLPHPVYVLHGYTGSGKTRLLHTLRDRFNVLDLEAAANHRGSLLGDFPKESQPGQRMFETRLAQALSKLDPGKPMLIEGESRKIGRCRIPKGLWRSMVDGIHLWIDIPRAVRVAFILDGYQDLKDPDYLKPRLAKLDRYVSKTVRAELEDALDRENWPELVEGLLTHHYDPLYARSHKRNTLYPIAGNDLQSVAASLRELAVHGLPEANQVSRG